MDFINGFDRNQLIMMDFESVVGQDSWARVVDLFVEMLPLKELGFNWNYYIRLDSKKSEFKTIRFTELTKKRN